MAEIDRGYLLRANRQDPIAVEYGEIVRTAGVSRLHFQLDTVLMSCLYNYMFTIRSFNPCRSM
eukprot:6463304-Amphidinium_carterae.1